MRRHRRGDPDRRAVLIERHHDLASVQLQPGAAATRCRAVDRVAENRPAHFGAMHAKLMGAAGEWFEREPGYFPLPLVGRGRGGGGGGGGGVRGAGRFFSPPPWGGGAGGGVVRLRDASMGASDLPTPTP